MNDVVFFMVNSRLQKEVRKTKDYNIDLASDDECTMEENPANSSLDVLYEDIRSWKR